RRPGAGDISRCIVRKELQRDRVQPVRRNDISGERLLVQWIVDRGVQAAEIPCKHRGGRNRIDALERLASPKSLIIGHKEQLVLAIKQLWDAYGPVKFKTEIVPLERILLLMNGGERERRGIQLLIAQELEQRAVVPVASRFREHVDLGGFVAELGRIDAGLYLKFLQGIDRWQDNIRVEVRVRIGDAIQREVVEHDALARGRDRLAGSVAALARAGLAGCRRNSVHIRRQRDQPKIVASIQRQLQNLLVLDHGAHGGILLLKLSGRGRNLDRFRYRSNLQGEI